MGVKRERNGRRDEDRNGKRDRKLAEQPSTNLPYEAADQRTAMSEIVSESSEPIGSLP